MTAAQGRDGRAGQGDRRGGLPEDPDLAAFAAAVGAVDSAAADHRPALTAVPAHLEGADREDLTRRAATEADPGEGATPELPDVPHGNLIRQATISVAAEVAERFREYQRQQAAEGPVPSNAEVVFRALEACRDRYADVVASRRPQPEPGRRFGAPVPGRRVTSEARLTSQVNYRPTYAEHAEIKRLQTEAGAPSVSAFLDAVLDEFLPQLPGRPRRRTAR